MNILVTDINENRRTGFPSSALRRPSDQGWLLASGIRRLSSGFTLIELLVVMVVAAIIMAVSLPSFINMGRGAGMRAAVNNVSSTIALSRQWAITHREQITFVAMSNLVYPEDAGNIVTNPAYTAFNHSAPISKGVPLPLDVTFAQPGGDVVTSLTFKTDGGLAGEVNTNTIVLVDKKDDFKKTITINRWTGGVTVE